MQKKGTVFLSTSLAWPAVADCSWADTFFQLSTISFAQPCSKPSALYLFVEAGGCTVAPKLNLRLRDHVQICERTGVRTEEGAK